MKSRLDLTKKLGKIVRTMFWQNKNFIIDRVVFRTKQGRLYSSRGAHLSVFKTPQFNTPKDVVEWYFGRYEINPRYVTV